jgi:hypothetical protein
MFKGLVTKLAKDAWDNAGKHEPQAAARPSSQTQPQQAASPEPEASASVETDIVFPYYPGEGTSCGEECRCRWNVQVRWSDEHNSNATFATWVTAGDGDVCEDCQQRAREWQDEMVRLEPAG